MQKEKFSFRIHSDLANWLRHQPSISATVNEALKRYHSRSDWRESDNAHLASLATEFTRIGTNINQIARIVNIANKSGDKAANLEDLNAAGRELRTLQSKLGVILRTWNS